MMKNRNLKGKGFRRIVTRGRNRPLFPMILFKWVADKIRAGLRSYITTIFGIATLIAAIFNPEGADPEAIAIAIGLIFARDGGTSSQQSGIRPKILGE